MDALLNISPLIKLAGVFVCIVALIRLRLSIGTALTAGGALLGLWFGLSPFRLVAAMVRSLVAERTVTLCAIISLILVLSHAMEKTGQMKRLLEAFRSISSNTKLNLAIFPALIGLLPMPGGAIFSAPMVHEMSNKETLSSEHKTLINYWFRHMWELSWPLYPGIILTVTLAGLDIWIFVLVQFPLTVVSALIGYVVLLRSIPRRNSATNGSHIGNWRLFIGELTPFLMVVAGALLLGVLLALLSKVWPLLKPVKNEIPLVASLVLSIWWVGRWNRLAFHKIWGFFFDRSLLSMVYMIVGVMMFQGILDDSRAVSEISQSFVTAHVPMTGIIILLPFLVGAVAGITVAFVGTTFPIIFSLLSSYGLADQILAYTVLAYCAGYLGVLLSPLHICLILTCEFFKTNLSKIYPRLALPCAVIGIAGVLSYWLNLIL